MVKGAKTTGQGSVAGQEVAATAAAGFLEVPIDQIIEEKQIRSEIDTGDASFLAMKNSIERVGLLSPPVAEKCDSGYRLLAGGIRKRACEELGMATIPVRVIDQVGGDANRISLQLTENMVRKDLNPIDLANACLAYFQALREGDHPRRTHHGPDELRNGPGQFQRRLY